MLSEAGGVSDCLVCGLWAVGCGLWAVVGSMPFQTAPLLVVTPLRLLAFDLAGSQGASRLRGSGVNTTVRSLLSVRMELVVGNCRHVTRSVLARRAVAAVRTSCVSIGSVDKHRIRS